MQECSFASSTLQSSGIVPINSLSFSLVDPTLCLKLHRKRDYIVVLFAVITWSHDLLPAHWTLGDAFSGFGTLIFTSYQGFHETCMAEQVTLKKTELVFIRETALRNDVPQWVAVRSFMFSMQIIHCNVDNLTGLLACSFCALMVAMRCCSRTLKRPVSSSRSCERISPSPFRQILRLNASCRGEIARREVKASFVHPENGSCNSCLYLL